MLTGTRLMAIFPALDLPGWLPSAEVREGNGHARAAADYMDAAQDLLGCRCAHGRMGSRAGVRLPVRLRHLLPGLRARLLAGRGRVPRALSSCGKAADRGAHARALGRTARRSDVRCTTRRRPSTVRCTPPARSSADCSPLPAPAPSSGDWTFRLCRHMPAPAGVERRARDRSGHPPGPRAAAADDRRRGGGRGDQAPGRGAAQAAPRSPARRAAADPAAAIAHHARSLSSTTRSQLSDDAAGRRCGPRSRTSSRSSRSS